MTAIRGLYVVRSGSAAPTLTANRADDAGGDTEAVDTPADGRLATLEVDFSRFGNWYEVDSFWEGHFLERVAKGSFKRTISQRGDQVKVLFNHGMDFNIGDKVLGVVERIEERDDSPHLEAGLLDTSYNRDLLPGLRAGAYGSSFMFEVLADSWDHEPEQSQDNPQGIPERTINEVRLHEAGPVTFPANPEATAGVRCGTDWLLEQMQRHDGDAYNEQVRSYKAFRAAHGLSDVTPEAPAPEPVVIGSARHVDGITAAARKRRLTLTTKERPNHAW